MFEAAIAFSWAQASAISDTEGSIASEEKEVVIVSSMYFRICVRTVLCSVITTEPDDRRDVATHC